ncbi:MAG: hypothetical protein JW969_06165 [Spirochaetales bacterium]|nr:hypothetical protein [Spirochaetales bacterium]
MSEKIMILPFQSETADLASAGGKGANLSILYREKFSVPEGFILTTDAYRAVVEQNRIDEALSGFLEKAENGDVNEIESISGQIRKLFIESTMPAGLSAGIEESYKKTGEGAVAVRSSATTEDLPDASFAGQQDTYLNIEGIDGLKKAVLSCMASLWTARAMTYRKKNGIPHETCALAVVVQKMVRSEASGVMFTADPLTGKRSVIVVEAVFGLGDAFVSGQVEPDTYRIDTDKWEIAAKKLGAKQDRNALNSPDRSRTQALPDALVLELGKTGHKITHLYGIPQDIEWALSEGKLYILQSRPITSLFPVPEKLPGKQLKVFVSFGAVQGLLDPITPLGREFFKILFAGGAHLAGFDFNSHTQPVLKEAGERLWINFTPVITNSFGRKVVTALDYIEPASYQAIKHIMNEPGITGNLKRLKFSTLRRMKKFFGPILKRVIKNWKNPERRQNQIRPEMELWIEQVKKAVPDSGTKEEKLRAMIDWIMDIPESLIQALPDLISVVASGVGPFNLVIRMSKKLTGSEQTGLLVNRGILHNVTTEMDLFLWVTALKIKNDEAAYGIFAGSDPAVLAQQFLAGTLPETAQASLASFMERYGARGFCEIDIGRERWKENPLPVIQSLQSYLKINPELAPDKVFRNNRKHAQAAVTELLSAAGRHPGGVILKRFVKWAVKRATAFLGFRELPKFIAIRMMGVIRDGLLECGRLFVQAGTIERADDLFYLRTAELSALAKGGFKDVRDVVRIRRDAFERERSRKQIPRVLLSDGRAFYEGMHLPSSTEEAGIILGSPVSPGVVEGLVRIVLDPHNTQLQPGEILICPGTDPSWTPLFLSASALVMEVGGMMTHGAVVAREYGIPAVVGVDGAVTRFRTGQRLRVNGSTGEITDLGSEI